MRFTLIYPVKTNNRKLFHKCNSEMANLFFADDGQNYCRLVIIRKWVYTIKDGTGRVCMLKSLRYIEDNTTWFTFFWYLAWFEGILDKFGVNSSWCSKSYCQGRYQCCTFNNTRSLSAIDWTMEETLMKFAKAQVCLNGKGFFHLTLKITMVLSFS